MRDQAERLREIVNSQNSKAPVRKARTIAITSGKGGVGKTNLSVNLAIHLSKLGQKVTLIDTDLGLANIDLIMGLTPKYHLGHFLSGDQSLSDIVLDGPAGVKVIAGGSGFQELADLSPWQVDHCITNLAVLEEENDFIILDTGAGISNKVVKFLVAAEEIVVVTVPEPTAIADAYGVIKVISRENSSAKVYVAVNMVENQEEGEQVYERLMLVAEKFLNFPLEPLGFIVKDPTVAKAVKQQQPFALTHPESKASLSILRIAQKMLALPEQSPGGLSLFLRRLFSRQLGSY
ncbi:MAG: MinD/ParA family protein [Firmicutes bacterium]|nr:MinD/ParA family protein [Bacillota bacterium]